MAYHCFASVVQLIYLPHREVQSALPTNGLISTAGVSQLVKQQRSIRSLWVRITLKSIFLPPGVPNVGDGWGWWWGGWLTWKFVTTPISTSGTTIAACLNTALQLYPALTFYKLSRQLHIFEEWSAF